MVKLEKVSAIKGRYNTGIFADVDKPGVTLGEVNETTMINLSAWDINNLNDYFNENYQLSLPSVSNFVATDNFKIIWIATNRYLLVTSSKRVAEELYNALNSTIASVFDVSSARTIIRVSGKCMTDVLAKGLVINLDESNFNAEHVLLSSFDNHYPAIIHRSINQINSVDIYVTRSLALSFWQWLCDASQEYGYEIKGNANKPDIE